MDRKLISISTEPTKNFGELLEYAKELTSVADFLHCDIMDSSFTDRNLLSADVISKLNLNSLIMLDVHLMTRDLKDKYIDYVNAGANILTVHYESFSSKRRLLKVLHYLKHQKVLVGLSFKPDTDIQNILEFASLVDLILIMSVNVGKSGQSFIASTYEKLEKLYEHKKQNQLDFLIEVDGGIVPEIAEKLFKKGADIIVSGSYVYNSENHKIACENLKKTFD